MFEQLGWLLSRDYRNFMAAASAWQDGRSPYGDLSPEFAAGLFPYPPTFLTWTSTFLPLGPLGFALWTVLTLALWAHAMKRSGRAQWPLLAWSPVLVHLLLGQSTLPVILVLWAAHLSRDWERPGSSTWKALGWGVALAWCASKPQVALFPLAALLWESRRGAASKYLWAGLLLGTALLALPPTLKNPAIWSEWITALQSFRGHVVHQAAWQGPSVVLFLFAAWLWHRSGRGGWRWWITACAFPQSTFYAFAALLPAMPAPLKNTDSGADERSKYFRWHAGGLLLAAVLSVPLPGVPLPWLLAAHAVAAWAVAGGTVQNARSKYLPA
jgi:hypothetical protein